MNAPHRSLLTLHHGAPDATAAPSERLHKVLANAGLGSRRALEERIERGEVTVNGTPAILGSSVSTGDRVGLDQHNFVVTIDRHEDTEVLMYNKPEGLVVSRSDEEGRATIFDTLPEPDHGGRWVAVGRLDINTTGLLLLTTDGELANALMHPGSGLEREYLCRVHGEVPDAALEQLRAGLPLDDGPAHFDAISVVNRAGSHSWLRVTLGEGRNREVRRLWEAAGFEVSRLKRIRYGQLELPRPLRPGQVQALDEAAVAALRTAAGLGQPQPGLTLSEVVHQRRAPRHVTEFRPDPNHGGKPHAWSAAHHHEARELTAYDHIREDRPRGRGKPQRPRGDVNGNVALPDKPQKAKKKRAFAPGQELPSIRTWFAGDSRRPRAPGQNRRPGSNRNRGPRR